MTEQRYCCEFFKQNIMRNLTSCKSFLRAKPKSSNIYWILLSRQNLLDTSKCCLQNRGPSSVCHQHSNTADKTHQPVHPSYAWDEEFASIRIGPSNLKVQFDTTALFCHQLPIHCRYLEICGSKLPRQKYA